MGPDRFDDVEFRMLEEPEPPRGPRLMRWTFAALSVVVATGALAAGASALTGESAAPAAKAQKSVSDTYYPRDYRDCDKGERHRRNLELKY